MRVFFLGDAPRIQGTDHAALEIDTLSADRANQTFPESDASEPDASWHGMCVHTGSLLHRDRYAFMCMLPARKVMNSPFPNAVF